MPTLRLGKYRGIVVDTNDPERLGRIRAKLPGEAGQPITGWALPCVPYAGQQVGLFCLPENGTDVWIEFEQGDPAYPVWTGCYWRPGNAFHAAGAHQPTVVLRTRKGRLEIDDSSSTITITTVYGDKVTVDKGRIRLTTGKGATIDLNGQRVAINDGALEVI